MLRYVKPASFSNTTRCISRSTQLLQNPDLELQNISVDLNADTDHDTPSKSGSRTQFKLVNNPPTIARLSISPNIPVYIRKGCLVSLYNNNSAQDISLTKEFISLWSNLINYASLKPSQYVKLISKHHSFNALISTNNSLHKNQQTSLFHLNLNGKNDWQIWGKDSIVAFEKNTSLEISNSKTLQFNKFKDTNFTVLKGRGNVLINGIGSILEIGLKNPYDEVLINYRNLLAISGKSQIDIKDSIQNKLLSQNRHTYKKITIPPLKNSQNEITFSSSISFISSLFTTLVQWVLKSVDLLRFGSPTNFIKINGPRTILVQSFNNTILDNNSIYSLEPLLEDEPKKSYIPENIKNDINKSNLNFAYVEPNGKVEFKKTLKFMKPNETE